MRTVPVRPDSMRSGRASSSRWARSPRVRCCGPRDAISKLRGPRLRLSRRPADPDLSPGIPAAEPRAQARRVGGHEEGPEHPAGRVMPRLVPVAVPVPFLSALTYRVPDGMPAPAPGMRVRVPLGSRQVTGCVLSGTAAGAGGAGGELRELVELPRRRPVPPRAVLDLTAWVAEYYGCGPGDAVAAAMPPFAWTRGSAAGPPPVSAFKTVRTVRLAAAGDRSGGNAPARGAGPAPARCAGAARRKPRPDSPWPSWPRTASRPTACDGWRAGAWWRSNSGGSSANPLLRAGPS